MNELLKCPFCGGEAERKSIKPYRKIKGRRQSYLAEIGCKGFGCTVQTLYPLCSCMGGWRYDLRRDMQRDFGWKR